MSSVRLFVVVLLGLVATNSSSATDWMFEVRFDESVRKDPYTGRVYLFFGKKGAMPPRDPRFGPNWFNPEPFVSKDVAGWKPGEPLTFDSSDKALLSYPKGASEFDPAGWRVQAVARFNPWEREVGVGEGNGFSEVAEATSTGGAPLVINKLVPERKFEENEWSKLLRVKSDRLSRFYGHDVFVQAAVLLPASYHKEPERRYPVMISVTGFGGTHHMGRRNAPVDENNPGGVEFLRVYPDPSCPLGHCVFANSANNGPWGSAFVEELLPALDKTYRTVAAPTARFLTGHSSGGWSSLWLQVAYPDAFGGTWSTAPDPVDFRDFQKIDLYRAGENMYVDREGQPRPIARRGTMPILWYRNFDHMETVLGYGGQLHSFEAVFSPRAKDGKPLRIWNRETGAVDSEAAKSWEQYDIRLKLEREWEQLGPKLKGKLHVFMGDLDTFYLEGATILLKESLKSLGSDAVVEIHPGKDHGSLLTPELVARIRREMAEAFLKNHPEAKRGE